MQVKVVQLSEAQRDSYLDDCGINGSELKAVPVPSTDDYDRNAKYLLDHLRPFGESGTDDATPYYVDEWSNPSCIPFAEIKDEAIVCRDLVVATHKAVRQMDENYRVHLVNAFTILDDELNVFVEKEVIYVYAQKRSWIGKLGLDEQTLEY